MLLVEDDKILKLPATMEPAPAKRRKLGNSSENVENALRSAASTGLSRSRAFALEAEELLTEVKLDYGEVLRGADDLLHKVKSSVEAIEPHGELPVRQSAL